MRRAPIVITATVVGLIGVLEFHTRTSPVSLGSAAGAASSAAPAATASPAGGGRAGTSGASPRASSGPGGTSAAGGTSGAGRTRTATGPAVNYNWGLLSVSVTVSGTRIAKVGLASLDDGGNPRSQMIDQQAIPILEQEAMQAQSANIQGVSGASYTSAGFIQSLQAALQQLGLR
jgi:FMN-binding domain